MADLARTFMELKGIMLPYARKLLCTVDQDDELSVDTRHMQKTRNRYGSGGCRSRRITLATILCPYI